MGGFFTSITSPGLMLWLAFTFCPPIVTRPFLMASPATERVLYMRAAHSHLSMRAEGRTILSLSIGCAVADGMFFSFVISCVRLSHVVGRRWERRYFFPSLLYWFIVMSMPCRAKLLM